MAGAEVLGGVALGMTLLGGITSAVATRQAAKANATVLDWNAAIADLQEQDAIDRGFEAVGRSRVNYRTLLGHLRHESGHFYWDRLVQQGGRLEDFRTLFGDERRDYAAALSAHYAGGPPPDWQEQHVSAYAAAHPWEDWAETWAHYLHMVDLLETAAAYDTALQVPGSDGLLREQVANPFIRPAPPFDTLVRQWVPLTLLLNSLNRSLGQPDAYPFALSAGALRKLRFVHDTVQQASSR